MVSIPRLTFGEAPHQSQIPLADRLSIGRSEDNRVVIADASVLPVQACILFEGNRCYIEDRGGESVTIVNDKRVDGRVSLKDGDIIQIGSARMQVCGLVAAEKSPAKDVVPSDEKIIFQCRCGKTLRAPRKYSGRKGKCAKCGNHLVVPAVDSKELIDSVDVNIADTSTVHSQPATECLQICNVCNTEIEDGVDDKTVCHACSLPFHTECWTENYGCSAYGCRNVDLLKPKPFQIDPDRARNQAETVNQTETDTPWGHVFLCLNVVAGLFSLLLYGIPSLFVASGTLVFFTKHARESQHSRLIVSIVLGFICFMLGFIVSLITKG